MALKRIFISASLRSLYSRGEGSFVNDLHFQNVGSCQLGLASSHTLLSGCGAAPLRSFISEIFSTSVGFTRLGQKQLPNRFGELRSYSVLATSNLAEDVKEEYVVGHGEEDYDFTEADREISTAFLRTMGVKEEKLSRLIDKCPSVLLRGFKDGMGQFLQTLRSAGVREQLACLILEKNPNLVMRILERNIFRENLEYLLHCGLSVTQLERVVRIYPQFLAASKQLQLQPTVEFLLRVGVTKGKIGKVVSLSPYYLGYRHEISLLPKVAFLISVGVKRENIGKIIMEQPSMLCLSVAENITPKLIYFKSLGVERERVGEIITRYPALLTSSMDSMKLKVDFFTSKGLVGKNLVNLLTLHPDLLGRSLESLNLGFENLQSFGFSQNEVLTILKSHPTVLGSSESHLRKKFEFLTRVMNRSLKEVLRFTAFVTYSLDGRIKPRHRVFSWLVVQGLLPRKDYSLRTIIGGSEFHFRERFLGLHPSAAAVYAGHLEAKDKFNANEVPAYTRD